MNAGQHLNVYNEPRSVLDMASISPAAGSEILSIIVLFQEAVKEVKSTLVESE